MSSIVFTYLLWYVVMYILEQVAGNACRLLCIVATGTSQGVSDPTLPHHGSSSSLASSACSVQSGCTEKTVDNLSMKEGRYDSMILDGR